VRQIDLGIDKKTQGISEWTKKEKEKSIHLPGAGAHAATV
jgi:hypothetical protein